MMSLGWTCLNIYVLSLTSSTELKKQRHVDIALGIILLISMFSLLFGATLQSLRLLRVFFILISTVIIVYWSWHLYIIFSSSHATITSNKAYLALGLVSTICSFLFILPILLFYRLRKISEELVTVIDMLNEC